MAGSATACILRVASTSDGSCLLAANLGDSGFKLIRNKQVMFASAAQEYQFNMPYQFGHRTHLPESSEAADAALMEVGLRAGDVIVLGTDGLFDNLFAADIVATAADLAAAAQVGEGEVARTAEALASEARRRAESDSLPTPWAAELEQHGHYPAGRGSSTPTVPVGGKLDDITVVVAYVEEA